MERSRTRLKFDYMGLCDIVWKGRNDRCKNCGMKENFEYILSQCDGYAAER